MKSLYLFLLAGLLSFNAIAEDNSWTGFYVGGNLGYAKADSDSKVTLGGDWSTQTPELREFIVNNAQDKQNPSGTAFGFQAGYDYQFENRVIIGLELDYNKLNLDKSRQTPLLDLPGAVADFAFSNKVEVNHSYSLRPKLGYAFDKTQLYVTAGYAWTSAEFSSDLVSEFNYSKVGKKSKTLTSAIWGFGVEHKFFDKISAKLEYLKINGDDTSYTSEYRAGSNFAPPAFSFSEKYNVDLDYDVIRAGINYRF
jgi:outer membrane immunogenic protein